MDNEPRILSLAPLPAGWRTLTITPKFVKEWPIACLALVEYPATGEREIKAVEATDGVGFFDVPWGWARADESEVVYLGPSQCLSDEWVAERIEEARKGWAKVPS